MSSTETNTMRIRGEFTPDPSVCRFITSSILFEDDWTFQFSSPEDAPGSPLIAALFAVEGVSEIKIHQDTFTVVKNTPDPWPKFAGRLIPIMREHLSAGDQVLDSEHREAMKTEPLDEDVPGIIEHLLETRINPALDSHGGFVKLLRVEDYDVYIEMGGGCQGCAGSRTTMKFGIESAIKDLIPRVRNVIDATDHSAGANPYYE